MPSARQKNRPLKIIFKRFFIIAQLLKTIPDLLPQFKIHWFIVEKHKNLSRFTVMFFFEIKFPDIAYNPRIGKKFPEKIRIGKYQKVWKIRRKTLFCIDTICKNDTNPECTEYIQPDTAVGFASSSSS
jgi:hypothetical protein